MSVFRIDMLPGREGDCLWIEYGDSQKLRRILIDGGRKSASAAVRKRLADLPPAERQFELLVLTHVDADHVEGLLNLVAGPAVAFSCRDVWFNGRRHLEQSNKPEEFGAMQGEAFSQAIALRGWSWNGGYRRKSVVIPKNERLPSRTLEGGMRLTLLSPTWNKLELMQPIWEKEVAKAGLLKRRLRADCDPPSLESYGPLTIGEVREAAFSEFKGDKSAANGSSIALLAEFDGRRVVFAGDCHAPVLASSLEKLSRNGEPIALDAFKVSHHGSRGTHSWELMRHMHCKRFLISTDGSRHRHPHIESIARIVTYSPGVQLRFNYATEHTLKWDVGKLKRAFGYSTQYPHADDPGFLRTEL